MRNILYVTKPGKRPGTAPDNTVIHALVLLVPHNMALSSAPKALTWLLSMLAATVFVGVHTTDAAGTVATCVYVAKHHIQEPEVAVV
eukprot:4474113-Pleurochrysis_carterae.AAC.2